MRHWKKLMRIYTPRMELNDDLEYVAKKLDWTPQEFRDIINLPPNSHKKFASNEFLFNLGIRSKRLLGAIIQVIAIIIAIVVNCE